MGLLPNIIRLWPSLALGMGGVGLALLTYLIGTRVLAFLPTAAFDSGPSS